MIEYTFRNAKRPPHNKGTSSASSIDESTAKEWKDRFRAYFPSLDVVKNSKGGLPSAGTICFQSKWYKSPTFPSQVLRDCESQRPGVLMHNKVSFQCSLGFFCCTRNLVDVFFPSSCMFGPMSRSHYLITSNAAHGRTSGAPTYQKAHGELTIPLVIQEHNS